MTKDPLIQWGEGGFPYDLLIRAGLTPASSAGKVREAALDLMAMGVFDRSQRAAWDELRSVERRLWIDLWLHLFNTDEVADNIETLEFRGRREAVAPICEHFLRPDFTELDRMEADFGPLDESVPEIEAPPLPADVLVEFDR